MIIVITLKDYKILKMHWAFELISKSMRDYESLNEKAQKQQLS